jgi:hypothetical protein
MSNESRNLIRTLRAGGAAKVRVALLLASIAAASVAYFPPGPTAPTVASAAFPPGPNAPAVAFSDLPPGPGAIGPEF